MNYLLEGAFEQVKLEIIDIEEALLVLKANTHLKNGTAVKLLSEKLAALNTEKTKYEEELN